MKTCFLVVCALGSLLGAHSALAYGSMGWDDARTRIIKDDPWLISYLERTFDMSQSGGAAMIGRHIDPKHAGERIPPFNFRATHKKTGEQYRLSIGWSVDHDTLTERWAFSWALQAQIPDAALPDPALGCFIPDESALASERLTWETARTQIIKGDPWLVRYLERTFDMSHRGVGGVIGRQIDQERASERIPAFKFRATHRKTGERYTLTIAWSADHAFTERWAVSALLERGSVSR